MGVKFMCSGTSLPHTALKVKLASCGILAALNILMFFHA